MVALRETHALPVAFGERERLMHSPTAPDHGRRSLLPVSRIACPRRKTKCQLTSPRILPHTCPSRYDSGSTDNTLEMLQPWMEAGTVKLHSFAHGKSHFLPRQEDAAHAFISANPDQAGHYQTTGLETCSRTYGPTTECLLEADIDEFHVATPYLTGLNRSQPILLTDVPDQPLRRILLDNWLYTGAEAVVVSRTSFKNAGLERLPDEASLLRVQTLRCESVSPDGIVEALF